MIFQEFNQNKPITPHATLPPELPVVLLPRLFSVPRSSCNSCITADRPSNKLSGKRTFLYLINTLPVLYNLKPQTFFKASTTISLRWLPHQHHWIPIACHWAHGKQSIFYCAWLYCHPYGYGACDKPAAECLSVASIMLAEFTKQVLRKSLAEGFAGFLLANASCGSCV